MTVPMDVLDLALTDLNRSVDAAVGEIDRLRAVNADLLAALKYAEGYLNDTLSPCEPDCECVLHPVQAAIAKAEGR